MIVKVKVTEIHFALMIVKVTEILSMMRIVIVIVNVIVIVSMINLCRNLRHYEDLLWVCKQSS